MAVTDPVWALLDVRQEDVGRIQVGMRVGFRGDGMAGEEAVGELERISAEADPKMRTVRARASLPNPAGRCGPTPLAPARSAFVK